MSTKDNGTCGAALALHLPPEALEQIAQRAAELIAQNAQLPEYLTPAEAGVYLRCSGKQRIYDLVSQRRLSACRDGSRLLLRRADLDAYVAGEPTEGRAA